MLALLAVVIVAACGETRSPIGDECLRGDDCLSGVCSSRTCVAAPPLVSGATGTPPDESVDIPDGSAAIADAGPQGG
ncbi:MAG: hypothetical protein JWP97_5550 [Labilithrix sp.]|nr:hypothetical protein [Labilithrix sp.]